MINSYFLDIFRTVISGLILIVAVFYLLKPYLDRLEKQPTSILDPNAANNQLSLQLQAYERLLLFIDRTNPVNLLVRLNDPAYLATELHYQVLGEIRNEFQHNITQQLYVSPNTWEIVKRIKNETISLANSAVKVLPPHASGFDFSKLILEQMGNMENNPYDVAAALIREDARQLFQH
ncbi:MAG: hypothetical protein V5804_00480 [Mucilaginibacter sp.]|uniref:DUF7935 family protein n=1 Tax=Mucilaginibacter sp. TaxID=1882438 RepID=UPI0034E40BE9